MSKLMPDVRLWIVITVCLLPLFMLTIYDHQRSLHEALEDVEYDAGLVLNGALIAEAGAVRQMESALRIMAGANDLRDLNPEECSGLARRMKAAYSDIVNIGATALDGTVFCSAIEMKEPVNASDRRWFRESLEHKRFTKGEFAIGRISRKPTILFGYPLSNADGTLRALLFASGSSAWFDRFTALNALPSGWVTMLFSRDGALLSHQPDPDKWQGKSFDSESLKKLLGALDRGQKSVTMVGPDGVERIYVFRSVDTGEGSVFAGVGVPVDQSLRPLREAFSNRVLTVGLITLFSLVVAVFLLRDQINRRLNKTVEKLKLLGHALETAPLRIFIKNRAGDIVYDNQGSGTNGALLTQLSGALADDPESDALVFSGQRIDKTIDHRDGNRRSVYHLIKTPVTEAHSGVIIGECVVLSEITERIVAEEAIERLSRAVEQSPESIVFTDTEGRIEYVNRAFTEVTGYSPEEVHGKNPRVLQSGKTPPERYEEMWRALLSGNAWRGELINKRKDGKEYLELASISPIRGADGQVTHYVAVKSDITNIRQAEEELNLYREGLERLVLERTNELAQAKVAAESANKAKSAFLANMSHEIRTPLNAVIGLSHLLKHESLTHSQLDKVDKIARAGEHLLQVISDILDLSRIETGRFELETSVFSPSLVLNSVVSLIEPQAAAKGLKLSVNVESMPLTVRGDPTRLRQALLNYASNALKFTREGSISFDAKTVVEDESSYFLRFTVRDTGLGISQEDQARLFHAFEQLDTSTTRIFGGSGLGLAITRDIARLMGGSVGVESSPGCGSSFWLTVRVEKVDGEQALQSDTDEVKADLRSGHILVAEDEPINAEVIAAMLADQGLEVTLVPNGQAALDATQHSRFDVVLMDLQMPQLDGISATRAIRERELNGEHLPIVALTANAFTEDREACLKSGMDDFLTKPLAPEELQRVMQRFLHSASTQNAENRKLEVPPISAEDRRTLHESLRELRQLLASGNADAVKHFCATGPSMALAFPVEHKKLDELIATYQFELALSLVDRLLGAQLD